MVINVGKALGYTDAMNELMLKPAFWDWWHRVGKKEAGGQDLQSRDEAQEEYNDWVESGRPNAPKSDRNR
jgi:hypothetical protein